MTRTPAPVAREWTPIILAIGLGTAINALTVAVLIDAIASEGPGLSSNATQVLTTAFGGIIGVLGSALGYRSGRQAAEEIQGDSGEAGTVPAFSRKGATMSTTTPDPNEQPDQVTTPAEEVQPDEQQDDDKK